ncbi:GNAT family N-acetyltransferase [Undibacterium sp. JH2W]|uniref:GNAT family N-acetyltransferase n=1 Tax=Undibacterium sp. JH2W TaxID=3413037 RepID=UPI003BF240E1
MLILRSAREADNIKIRKLVQASLADFDIAAEFNGLDAAIGSAGLPDSENLVELVAEFEQKICGCVALERLQAQEGKVFGFHVDKDFRGKGIGRGLLAELVQRAKQCGLKTLHLDTWDSMQSAVSLYVSLGWVAAPDPMPDSGANRSFRLEIS